MKHFQFKNFDYSQWEIPEHETVRDSFIREKLYRTGFHIEKNFLSAAELQELYALYAGNHDIHTAEGGVFVSLYSSDKEYRKKMNELLMKLLQPKLDGILQNYKLSSLNFIAKYPGKRSSMFIHQDIMLVDEFQFSEVGIWIPLQDVDVNNGTIGLLPNSHFTIPPHRSLNQESPFRQVNELIFSYLQPVVMKAGELLLYDPRILHNSFTNQSEKPRIAIISRAAPENAPFMLCHREVESDSQEFEMIEVADDFFLNFDDFRNAKMKKPEGKVVSRILKKDSFVEADEFLDFIKESRIVENNIDRSEIETNTFSIGENNMIIEIEISEKKNNQEKHSRGRLYQYFKRIFN